MNQVNTAFEEINDTFLKQSKTKFPDLIREQLLRDLFKRSPYLLGRHCLGYSRFCDTHIEWDKIVRSEIDLTGRIGSKSLYLYPRETFKTTFFSICVPICFHLNNPDLSILIANEIEQNAMDFLKEIKSHYENNELFRYLFGDMISKDDWNKHQLNLSTRRAVTKEPSLMATGIGSATTSKHPDVIICDDIVGAKDRDSEPGRQQTFSFFNDQWDLLKKENGIFMMPGTRWHVKDVYNHIMNVLNPQLIKAGLKPFNVHVKPANEGGTDEGKINYPRLLSKEKLKELRIVKKGKDGVDICTYMAQYQLNPIDPATQIFRSFTYYNHATTKYKLFLQWTDPALSSKQSACYAPVVVIGKIADGAFAGKWGVVYASMERREPTETIKTHNRIYLMFKAQYPGIDMEVMMESNGFQQLMANDAVIEAMNNGKEVPTMGIKNTENKDARIASMEPAVTGGFLLFRDDYLDAPENYKLLMEQLREFAAGSQGFKDGPDALQCAYKQSRSRFYEGI